MLILWFLMVFCTAENTLFKSSGRKKSNWNQDRNSNPRLWIMRLCRYPLHQLPATLIYIAYKFYIHLHVKDCISIKERALKLEQIQIVANEQIKATALILEGAKPSSIVGVASVVGKGSKTRRDHFSWWCNQPLAALFSMFSTCRI